MTMSIIIPQKMSKYSFFSYNSATNFYETTVPFLLTTPARAFQQFPDHGIRKQALALCTPRPRGRLRNYVPNILL